MLEDGRSRSRSLLLARRRRRWLGARPDDPGHAARPRRPRLVTFQLTDALQRGNPRRDPQRADHHVRLRRRAAPQHSLWLDRTIARDGQRHRALRQPDPPLPRHAARRRPTRGRATLEREDVARAWLTRFDKLPLFSSAPRAQRRVLPPRPRPHDAAQRVVRLAVGGTTSPARQVHVPSISGAGARHPARSGECRHRHPSIATTLRDVQPATLSAPPRARPTPQRGGRSATTRA